MYTIIANYIRSTSDILGHRIDFCYSHQIGRMIDALPLCSQAGSLQLFPRNCFEINHLLN